MAGVPGCEKGRSRSTGQLTPPDRKTAGEVGCRRPADTLSRECRRDGVRSGCGRCNSCTEIEDVEKRCAGLAAKGQFVRTLGVEEWPDGTIAGRYSFSHALYQNVVYERVAAARRIGLHRRIGERKEAAYGQRTGEIASELAVHFEKGRDHWRAVRYLEQAGKNAIQRHAHQEAIGHLTNGLELLRALPDTPERIQHKLTLQLTLVSPLLTVKGYTAPEVEQTYARARDLCRQFRRPTSALLCGVIWAVYISSVTRRDTAGA